MKKLSQWTLGLLLGLGACTVDLSPPGPTVYVIPAGQHKALPDGPRRWEVRPRGLTATVTFDSTCIYDLRSVDQGDWNKLVGLGFVGARNQGFEAPHQVDGVRIGWRWSPARQRIELASYVYVAGERQMQQVAETAIGQPITLRISVDYDRRVYRVGEHEVPFTHRKTLAYQTGVYFGGNRPAPHTMRILIHH